MAEIKLPFLNSYRDPRNGRMPHQFRRKGCRRFKLKGKVGSAEFMEHYAELVAQSEDAVAHIDASRVKAGTIDALILRYLRHDSFTGLAKAMQVCRRPILDRFRDYKTPSGRRYGDNRIGLMRQQNVAAWLEGKTPNAKKNALKVIRQLIAFAIAEGECKTDPTIGMKTMSPAKSKGHLTCGDKQIEKYRAWYAYGTMARLAIELVLNIAARRHDAHLIGRPHLRNGCLSWRPTKTAQTTGKLLTIRVGAELQDALNAMPQSGALTFLLTDYGRPFASAAAFGNKFADWCRAAGLKPVVCDDGRTRSYRLHGLRKAACKQLAHAGCTGPEIMSVSGHNTLAQVQIYIDEVEQGRMAASSNGQARSRIKTGTERRLTFQVAVTDR